MSDRISIALSFPYYGLVHPLAAEAFNDAYWNPDAKYNRVRLRSGHSALTENFNVHLAHALDLRDAGEVTHLVMQHSDVQPLTSHYATILLEECERLQADMVSAVIPIKDPRSVTSTGVADPNDRWHLLFRFTMDEVFDLPETFGAMDTAFPNHRLVLNTGCMILDLRRPVFNREVDLCFKFENRIVKTPEGRKTEFIPEDYAFSEEIQKLGGRVYATRKVAVAHHGTIDYRNDYRWGQWKRDETSTLHKKGA